MRNASGPDCNNERNSSERDATVLRRSLARLLAAHNRRDEAKAGLVPVVAGVTEGFADRDFKEAAALLRQLD
jgi:predicted ATPase